jgi:hypothetical protein
MVVMTRRNAVCASGVALVTPLAGKLIAKTSSWQPGASGAVLADTTASSGNGRLSADLQAYVVNNVPRVLANMRKGQATPQDYQNLSSRLHMFARHIGGVDTEPFRAGIVASFKTSSAIDLSQLDGAKQAYSRLRSHDPDLAYSEFQQSLTLSPDQLEGGRRLLAANPIAWHFHNFADSMQAIASGIGAGLLPMRLDPGPSSGLLAAAVYHPGAAFHLQQVSTCGLTAKQWCLLLAGTTAFGLTLLAIAASSTVVGVSAAVASLATSLGWSVAALIEVARVGAAIASFIVVMCATFA